MTKKLDTSRFSAYDTYLKAAADQLDKPIDDDLVKIVAATRLQLDLVVERQLAGRDVDTSDLLKIGETLRSAAPQEPVREHTVILRLVPPTDGARDGEGRVSGLKACRACGWRSPATDTVASCYKCGWRLGDDVPSLPLPQPELRDVSPAIPEVVTPSDETKVLQPDMIAPPVKPVRYNEPEPPMFSACTIGKGVQTSDRWSR